MDWKIERKGRKWTREEVESRYHGVCPEKIELIEGKLFWTEEDRLNMLAMLLENVGIDKVIRLADLTQRKNHERVGRCDVTGKSKPSSFPGRQLFEHGR